MVESDTPPQAQSPIKPGNTEVTSQRVSPTRGGGSGADERVPEVNTSAIVCQGETVPMATDGREPKQSELPPNTVPGASMAPESGRQPPTIGGGASAPTASSINLEAPNTLEEALQGASIVEEHRTLMGAVMEKVRSAKSGLTEAFNSLLTGFEVSDVIFY